MPESHTMSLNWRELTPAELEKHFNPRVAVPEAQRLLDGFAARSADARKHIPGRYDLRYGPGPKATLDLHAPGSAASDRPLVVFIHGGYWRALDKRDHSFVVPPLLETGAVVANVNYDLCPEVTLDAMVDAIAAALRFCHAEAAGWGADPGNLVLVGHSAGAHLAAAMLQRPWPTNELPAGCIRAVAALTGIYEPEVILGISVNAEARISAQAAAHQDCLTRAFTMRPRMLVAAGGDEPEGWVAQSEAFAAHCVAGGLPTQMQLVSGANHFTMLEYAVRDGHPLRDAVFDLWR
jgi:arylformamidase